MATACAGWRHLLEGLQMQIKLDDLGWDENFAAGLKAGEAAVARVSRAYKGAYMLLTASGEIAAEITGKLRHAAASTAELPAVGDWVAYRDSTITRVLDRRTKLSRLAAGSRPGEPGREQVMAANIDTVFLVSSLNQEFNLRRIERYLSAIRAGGAEPVILLTKAECCEDPQRYADEAAAVAACPVHALSVHAGLNLEIFGDYLKPGRTAVLVGSSGVGKSTIVNWLMERQAAATACIRDKDDKGRHTTTYRHLFVLPGGGLLIDTPGIRELRLWEADAGRDESFDDIAALARDCRFSDCRHKVEPGCAVRQALTDGALDEARYLSYLKLGETAERQRHGKR